MEDNGVFPRHVLVRISYILPPLKTDRVTGENDLQWMANDSEEDKSRRNPDEVEEAWTETTEDGVSSQHACW
jgi:hypothetical protein